MKKLENLWSLAGFWWAASKPRERISSDPDYQQASGATQAATRSSFWGAARESAMGAGWFRDAAAFIRNWSSPPRAWPGRR